jgi:hypothetical protein
MKEVNIKFKLYPIHARGGIIGVKAEEFAQLYLTDVTYMEAFEYKDALTGKPTRRIDLLLRGRVRINFV